MCEETQQTNIQMNDTWIAKNFLHSDTRNYHKISQESEDTEWQQIVGTHKSTAGVQSGWRKRTMSRKYQFWHGGRPVMG